MTSRMYVTGIEVLTGCNSTFTTATNWNAIASATYGGYWRCTLGSAMGTYTVENAAQSTQFTEITGTNYSALGVDITGAGHNQNSITYAATGHIEYVCSQADAAPQWTTLTETTAAFADIIASTGTASTSPIICAFDLGATYACTAGTFTITFGTDNAITHSVFSITVS